MAQELSDCDARFSIPARDIHGSQSGLVGRGRSCEGEGNGLPAGDEDSSENEPAGLIDPRKTRKCPFCPRIGVIQTGGKGITEEVDLPSHPGAARGIDSFHQDLEYLLGVRSRISCDPEGCSHVDEHYTASVPT